MRTAPLLLVAALLASPAAASDGGSGTYIATGRSFAFNLLNSGTTGWQYFAVVGPPGATFAGGATIGEITARCVAGQPDGQPNEIECGPLAGNGIGPGAHVGFVATLDPAADCGSPFELEVSSTAGASFTTAGTAIGTCAKPYAVEPPALRGKPLVGSTLTATAPEWSDAASSLAYQWQLCTGIHCRAIAGATKTALKVTKSDVGHTVRVVATATVDGARLSSASKGVAVLR